MRTPLISLVAGALLAACTVGPQYSRPDAPAPDAYGQLQADWPQAEPVAEFWRGFDDATLTRLVEEALSANTDLRVALARLDQARALTRQSRLDRFPAVTAGAGHTRTRASADQAPGVPREARTSDLASASVDASWELDLFGRVRRSVEASGADSAAVGEDFKAAQVTVAAEVARTYFELRGAQERLRVARRNADNQRTTQSLTQARLDAGRGTRFDLERIRGELESTLARIPSLEAAVSAGAHRLAVLTGRPPTALLEELRQEAPLPVLPGSVAVGTPADLLRRRPDIQAAERRLAAATARVGVAAADLFPRVTFGGSVGVSAGSLGDLFTRDGETHGFGPGVSWAFLDLARVRARIGAAQAGAEASLALYEGTVLRALEEAENALVSYAQSGAEGRHLERSAAARGAAAQLADLRFQEGASDFLQVLDAQRSQLDSEDRLAQNRTNRAIALIAVYKAVAGGWPERVAASQSVSARLEVTP